MDSITSFFRFGVPYEYSPDVAYTDEVFLRLNPNELYTEYVYLGDMQFHAIEVEPSNSLFYYEYTTVQYNGEQYMVLKVQFGDISCKRLMLTLYDSKTNTYITKNSIAFNVEESNDTTNVIYWHKENIYGIPYKQADYEPQCMRLPLYFLNKKTNEESEEYVNSVKNTHNVQLSRVQRVFKSVWNVVCNDDINNAIATVSDSDYTYFDGVRQVCDPYVYEETKGEAQFSISTLTTQPNNTDIISIPTKTVITASNQDVLVPLVDAVNFKYQVLWNNTPLDYNHIYGVPIEDVYIIFTQIPEIGDLSFVSTGLNIQPLTPYRMGELQYKTQGENVQNEQFKYVIEDEYGNRSAQYTVRLLLDNEDTQYYNSNYYNSQYYG